jgi:uncharacterized coiled-coil protein SlyX
MDEQDRLTRIEEKLAYLEQYVGDLDDVVRDLAKRLDVHGEGVSAVRKLIEDHLSDPGDSADPGDEKPPHW